MSRCGKCILKCIQRIINFYSSFFNYFLSFTCAICCCLFGMVIMILIFWMYYSTLFPSFPTASLEHTGMYDYVEEYHDVSKGISGEKEADHGDYYYDSIVGNDNILRFKRNSTDGPVDTSVSADSSTSSVPASSMPTVETTSAVPPPPTIPEQGSDAPDNPSSTTAGTRAKTDQTTSTIGPEIEEPDEPDFHLSNVFMDSVFSHAEGNNMKEALGLCRKGGAVKLPEFQATFFPAEQASDILECINDVMKNQTKKEICVQLDGEMSAYLRWLVVTGEPREQHKCAGSRLGPHEEFLFPSTPCAKGERPIDQASAQVQCLAPGGAAKAGSH